MAPPKTPSTVKPSPGSARPKKVAKSQIITLKLSPKNLKAFHSPKIEPVVKQEAQSRVTTSAIPNVLAAEISSPGENASESNSNTPAPVAVDSAFAMPPPAMKKGVKRSSAVADGLPKPRAKPGPKKKAKLEDGSAAPVTSTAAHKLGPKANQGAINAGLRALDRTGKPCRKWQKGGFTVKSFTGTIWEIPRWKAPPKLTVNGEIGSSSSGNSSKENKESSQGKSEQNSTSAAEVDAKSAQSIPASSPAPLPVAIAAT